MATLVTARRQPSLLELDPEPPPPGGLASRRAPAAPAACAESLEDRIGAVWAALMTGRLASCPICGGDLAPRYSAGARPVGGRCRSCGTELA